MLNIDNPEADKLAADLMDTGCQCAAYPDLDTRPDDEILVYNEFGTW